MLGVITLITPVVFSSNYFAGGGNKIFNQASVTVIGWFGYVKWDALEWALNLLKEWPRRSGL